MNRAHRAAALQQLGGVITEAYSVVCHGEKRANYDRKLAQTHMQAEEEENTDHCFRLATNCQHGGNITGCISWFRRCVRLAPQVAKYHMSLATGLAMLNHFRREAVEHFHTAIELDQLTCGSANSTKRCNCLGARHRCTPKFWRSIRFTTWRASA